MGRKGLTDRLLKSLKPAKPGKHYDRWEQDGLGVRVSDKGTKTFVLMARVHGPDSYPTRRAIGHYPSISLADARATAAQWRRLIAQGKDPAIEIGRQQAAELRKRKTAFATVAEDFIRDALKGQRKAHEVARDIRRVFISVWGKRPITDISALEARDLIKGFVNKGKLYQAHNLLSYGRRLYDWAIEQDVYGIETSPFDRLKPKSLIGKKQPRSRILHDHELRAAWLAAEKLGYPYAAIFRLLILTGQRRSEVIEAQWPEFDLEKRLWTIPAERMKAGAAHVVPLTEDVLEILKGLPRYPRGNYLFSVKGAGKAPANSIADAKVLLDKHMLDILRKDNPDVELVPFVTHDLRRTMRTGLSGIAGISDLVRELVIGHTKPGLHKVYDQYAYLDEKRFALDSWAARLRVIVNPPPPNVTKLDDHRAQAAG
jgi:integrase